MKPPPVYRLLNMIRAYWERDDRLLIEQWKDTFKPGPKRKTVPFNLQPRRDCAPRSRRQSRIA